MIFRQIFDRESCTYTYLMSSGVGREAIIIDPVIENVDQYIRLIKELDLKLVVALDTHIHADHITASGKLRDSTKCSILMGEHSKAECLSASVKEDEQINVDGLKFRALYTPGHTDCSYSFCMDDRVFTGDTLMIRATGRTDFQNGSAEQQYDSIFNKLFLLEETIKVYPAHDYNGMTVSTIAEEKKYNPRLQVNSLEEYVKIMSNLNLDLPKKIDIAVPANLKCGLA